MSHTDVPPNSQSSSRFLPEDKELVVALWDLARTCRLSELYYSGRLARYTRLNFWVEVSLAVTATGGVSGLGVSGFDVVKTTSLGNLWPWFVVATAILAIAKPFLALDRKLRNATEQQQTYRRCLGSFEDLAFDVEQSGEVTAELRRRFQSLKDLMRQAQDQDDAPPEKALGPIQERVQREMPAERLWVPTIPRLPTPG